MLAECHSIVSKLHLQSPNDIFATPPYHMECMSLNKFSVIINWISPCNCRDDTIQNLLCRPISRRQKCFLFTDENIVGSLHTHVHTYMCMPSCGDSLSCSLFDRLSV